MSSRDMEDHWERSRRYYPRREAFISALPYLVPVGFLIVLTISIILVVVGAYTYRWEWTGFLGKTLWDWMKLLLVPAILALGGLLITQMERFSAGKAQQIQMETLTDQRRSTQEQFALQRQSLEQEQMNAQQRFNLELYRQQDERLQAYLDRMTQLLLDTDKRVGQSKEGEEVRMLARAWTLAMLGMLQDNPGRKSVPLQFLHAAGLIERGHAFVLLSGADLSGADLEGVRLDNADLSNTDLDGANLTGVGLSRADLSGADLSGADLSGANLFEAEGLTDEQIAAAESLEGATMPNDQKYEEWIKSKGHGENGEIGNPS